MRFAFYNPVRIITGKDCVRENASEFAGLGKSCLLVTSGSAARKSGALDDVTAALQAQGIRYMLFDEIEQNPTVESCQKAGRIAMENHLEFVIGIGGGSPLDAAKAATVYAANDMADCMDIYKVNWKNPALPCVAVGTTAGTGSEVTCFSILTMPNGRKKSFGAPDTYPRFMLGDARYTATLPLDFTLSTALDSLAHACEAYFNSAASAITDMYAVKAVKILYSQMKLLRHVENERDISIEQREELYFASVAAGIALSQCGTVYCHTLGYYLTENYGVPHGFACAALLPDLIMRSVKYAPDRAKKFFGETGADADELCELIEALTKLPEVNISHEIILRISRDGAETKNFKKTLPKGLSEADSIELMTRLFGGCK